MPGKDALRPSGGWWSGMRGAVHSAAARVLGAHGYWAEDVARSVFALLAGKARGLPATIELGG